MYKCVNNIVRYNIDPSCIFTNDKVIIISLGWNGENFVFYSKGYYKDSKSYFPNDFNCFAIIFARKSGKPYFTVKMFSSYDTSIFRVFQPTPSL